MTEHGQADLVIDEVDALIAELEEEYTEVRELSYVGADVTSNCMYHDVADSAADMCCKTF